MRNRICIIAATIIAIGAMDAARADDDLFPPELVRFAPIEQNPVFKAAGKGHWDVQHRERGWILRDGKTWRLWFTGYDGTREGQKLLGYATSHDGIHWTRHPGNPIYREHWIEDMMVVKKDGLFYMFAEGKDDVAQLLKSKDGVHWKRIGPLDIRGTNGKPIAAGPRGTPTAYYENGTWYLFYERYDKGVWLATSKDMAVWKNVSDEPVLKLGPGESDRLMIALNQIIKYKGRYYALYHGSGTPTKPRDWTTNIAVSTDLHHWKKYPGNPLLPTKSNKSSGILIHDGKQFRLYTMHDEVHLHMPVKKTDTKSAGKLGAKAEGLRFVDLRYLRRTLDDFGNKKAYVIVFTNTDCPIVQRYLPRLKKLDDQYGKQGVQFLSLSVGPEESVVDVAAQAVKADIAFPFAKDFSGAVARKLGVTRTPEVVLLDAKKQIRYRGRIDADVRFGGVSPKKSRADLQIAIDEVLAGRDVSVKETPVDGCLISFPDEKPVKKIRVTFSEHIAPLMQKHCQVCHRPDAEAPFSLLTYADAKQHAAMIGEVVQQQRMPPWFASKDHGKFINRAAMTAAERRLIVDWIAAGLPEGDPKKLPKPNSFPKVEWEIGKPDLVIKSPTEQKLPAEGYIPYRYIVLPYLFLQDTWVERIEILPGNRKAVHHCNLGYITMENGKPRTHFITGFVPGGSPMVLDKGTGFKIPRGAVLGLQMHYVTTGKETTDRTSVGFVFPKGKVDRQIRHLEVTNRRFAIEPEAPHHRVVAERTLTSDSVGVGMFVHMHLRGKDMTFNALYPDGKKETLLLVPNYSFDWQIPYRWAAGTKKFPKGTRIQCVAHFDNSAFNPYNPDPKKTVKFGLQTFHEMMYGFFFYLDENEQLNLKIDPKSGYVITR